MVMEEEPATDEAALAPARFSYRQVVLGCGGSERFAQVSLVGEKGRFAVVVRHTLRSQSTNHGVNDQGGHGVR